jgi:integrase/recombinase XerD
MRVIHHVVSGSSDHGSGGVRACAGAIEWDDRGLIALGHPLLDFYLELVRARARWNTVLATGLRPQGVVSTVMKDPTEVATADVFTVIKDQRCPRRGANVVRIDDGGPEPSARTIKRRLATVADLYVYLVVRGDPGIRHNPVPRGLSLGRPRQRAVRGSL